MVANSCNIKTLSTRLLVAAWCLVAIVIVNSYTTTLASYLMAPRYKPLVNSIEDIADSSRPMLMVLKEGSYESFLLVFSFVFKVN